MPLMKDWYEQYYRRIETSKAYAQFCERVFGENLGQHGFADMRQVQQLVDALAILPDELVVDLGCGTGGITKYVTKQTQSRAIGVDFVERAVQTAKRLNGSSQLLFAAADIGQTCLQTGCADVLINIDAAYFHPVEQIVSEMKRLLSPRGRLGLLYTIGPDRDELHDELDRTKLTPDRTPIAREFHAQGLEYSATDVTKDDYDHAVYKKQVLESLHDEFMAEGNEFLYDNRCGEANGAISAINNDVHARYLYVAARIEE